MPRGDPMSIENAKQLREDELRNALPSYSGGTADGYHVANLTLLVRRLCIAMGNSNPTLTSKAMGYLERYGLMDSAAAGILRDTPEDAMMARLTEVWDNM